jgi:hypothetical protein
VGVGEVGQFFKSDFSEITSYLTNAVKQRPIELTHPSNLPLLPPKKSIHISSFSPLFSSFSF